MGVTGFKLSQISAIPTATLVGNNSGSSARPTALDASTVRTQLSLRPGTDIQAYDSDLAAIAALTPSNDDFLQFKSSAWSNRTVAQVKTDLGFPIDLSGSNATGTLATARLPAFTGGDVTSSAASLVLSIASNAVVTAKINDGAVTNAKIADATIVFGKIATSAWSDDTTLASDSSVAFPTQHAVKTYIDSQITGLKFKKDVRVASTANVSISSAPSSIDGVTLAASDRVLLKNQTTASENGVWVFASAGSALARATDGDTNTELISATFPVREGTANQDTWWTVTNDTITLGSTSIVFTQTGGAGTYTAGSGITLTGNSFSISAGAITNAMLAGSIDLTSKVTGILPSANGGTGIDNGGRTITISTNSGTVSFSSAALTLTVAAAASVSGTNTGDQTITLTGHVTGSGTGSFATTIAAGVVTNAMLAGSIDLTTKVTGILPSANGGTANGFTKFTGPASSEKTFTLPNASATILTDNAVVTAAQGGTGVNNSTRTLTISTNGGTLLFSSASLTLTIAAAASVSGTNTGDQTITLTGNVTGSGTGSFATTIAAGVVTFAMLATAAWSDDTTLISDSSTLLPTQHAVKTYVDNQISGLTFKVQAVVATTANITLSGTQTIDGVAVVAGNRVLVKNQTTASANGIYVVAAGAWTRATDGDTGPELVGSTFPVMSGTVNQDTWWTVTNTAITIGSTSITFSQTGGAGTYVAGSGLTLTGNSFSISSGGVTNAMLAGSIDLTSKVTGILPSANGGTGVNNSTRTLTINTNSGTLAFAGASTTMTFPSTTATIARTDAAQTFTGTQTFSSTISGSINGNAATVTTNANLTGHVTSSGNTTSLGSFTLAQLNTAVSDADVARTDAANTFTGVQTITNITLPTNGQVLLTVPTTDGHSTGPTTNAFNCGYTSSAVGDLVYLDSSSTWQKCDANTLLLYNGLLAIALEVKSSGQAMLVALPGSFVYAVAAFPTFTIGGPVFMSETPAAVTQTAPTTTDAATRMIGWGVHADKMYFYPSADYITHV